MTEGELLEWALSLEDSDRDYLLELAATEHRTSIEEANAQESRIVAIAGWAIVGIGTLAVAELVEFTANVQGIASILAISASFLVIAAGAFALWPRDVALGLSASWFAAQPSQAEAEMRTYALAALMYANEVNDRLVAQRVTALKAMTSGFIGQVSLIVVAVIAATA